MCSPEREDHENIKDVFKEAIRFVLLLFIGEMKALNDEISQNGATVWKTAQFPVLLLLSVKDIIYVPLYTHIHYIIQNTHTHQVISVPW